jgi:hypothetical protein
MSALSLFLFIYGVWAQGVKKLAQENLVAHMTKQTPLEAN